MEPQTEHAPDRARSPALGGAALWRGVCLGLGLLAGATLGAAVVAHLHGLMIEDDAFVFVRYADNLLAHHTVAWNPGGPASYGTTSLLHLLLVVMVRVLVGARPATVAVVASLVGGLLFLAAIVHLLWRSRLRHAPSAPFLAVLLALPLAWSGETLAAHFVTGMDTTLALFYVVLLLAVGVRFEARPTAGRATAVALVAGGTWAARPDLGILAAGIVIALLVSALRRSRRDLVVRLAGLTLGVLALQWLLCWIAFDTPVPLSFFAKSAVRYGAGMEAAYAGVPGRELSHFARSYWLYVGLIVAAILSAGKRRRWGLSAIETGSLAGGLAFILYYRTLVLQVMPHFQRFYYPTLPIWIFLAARAGLNLAVAWQGRMPPPRTAARRAASGVALALVALVGFTLVRAWPRWVARSGERPWFAALHATENLDSSSRQYWFRLEDFSQLPDDVVWATTEIGLPGVLNPRRTIVDLSGLNDIEFARRGFTAEALFRRAKPDLIYMPPADYREMIQQLVQHPAFRTEYEYYPPRALGTGLGLAVRKGGVHAAAIQGVLRRGAQGPAGGAPRSGR